jgi:hypothetical protein
MKKTSKGMELATPRAAITKMGKHQMTDNKSEGEDKQNSEPVIK